MDKTYDHRLESKIYALWENAHAFEPQGDGEPYSILLPPPNANASLHAGHAMYVIEDILVRWKRMQGYKTVWIPGTDHAGYESQYVYEKHLAKQGKSRFDFDRETLYNDIFTFVRENSGLIEDQLKKLGFSLDWSRKTFMLDSHVVETVYKTFEKLAQDGLIYRDHYIVNYCPKCGTTFADLEVTYKDQQDPMYYIQYGPFVIATVRPETMYGDTAIAVHPADPRYSAWIGKSVEVEGPLGPTTLPIIADDEIDMAFGTGVMKVTPPHDFALAKKHHLPVISVINTRGKIELSAVSNLSNTNARAETTSTVQNLSTADARKKVVEYYKEKGLLVKIDEKYTHRVAVCYKSGHLIEPLVLPNWFIKMKPLAEPAINAVRTGKVKFFPTRFESQYYEWLGKFIDWPISRQTVWGIRIPVWYSTTENPDLAITYLSKTGERITGTAQELLATTSLEEIAKGLQQLRAPITAKYVISSTKPSDEYLPETDTFDTWFSSGQWPLTTLKYPEGEDFKTFYPTAVLDTMWDILFFWVARMIMLGLYMTGEVPFKTVYLHSMVTDEKGQKMSKSKGNVINPIEIVDQFGADALRISLVAGSTPGNPIAMSREKVKGYRNFSNKLWNIARFFIMQQEKGLEESGDSSAIVETSAQIIEKTNTLITSVTKNLDRFRFSDAALELYDFIWNDFANTALEQAKEFMHQKETFEVFFETYLTCLKLLHPFMPFVTESIWQELGTAKLIDRTLLIQTAWPTQKRAKMIK